jgi:hypothetical protein
MAGSARSVRKNVIAIIKKEIRLEQYVGIHVSKHIHVAIEPTQQQFDAPYHEEGITRIVASIHDIYPSLVILMEQTDKMDLLGTCLKQAKLPVVCLHDEQAQRFAQRLPQPTNQINAQTLAAFGKLIQPKSGCLRESDNPELNALLSRRLQLIEMLMSEKNRLRLSGQFLVAEYAAHNIHTHIAWLEQALEDVDIHLQPFWLIERSPNLVDDLP